MGLESGGSQMHFAQMLFAAVLSAGILVPAVVWSVVWAGPAGAAADRTGEVFLVQGVVGTTWTFSVDGEVVGKGVEAKGILGGLDLAPGVTPCRRPPTTARRSRPWSAYVLARASTWCCTCRSTRGGRPC